jgi:hypothetical protein
MRNISCQAFQQWLGLQEPPAQRIPPPELVAHVARCPACRAALTTYAVAVLPTPTVPAAIVCADCEPELDAFIDSEERDGMPAALRGFPQIWWHLHTCPDCAEIHFAVHALLQAETAGELPRLAPSRFAAALHLPRSYLHTAVAPQQALGVHWGAADAQQIAATRIDDYELTLSTYQHAPDAYTLIVELDPPAIGAIEVRLDPLFVRVPLAPDGSAQIPDVPATLLTAAAGEDLFIDLELDDPIA